MGKSQKREGTDFIISDRRLQKRQKKRRGSFVFVLMRLSVVVSIALFVYSYCIFPVKMEGASMEPTLGQGSMLFVNRIIYGVSDPSRFDLAAFSSEEGKIQIKRIIGLPGETVCIRDGVVYINDRPLQKDGENYPVVLPAGRASKPVLLAADEYFVLGDDPARSQDSRSEETGNVSKKDFLGVVWAARSGFLEWQFIFGNMMISF